jgi:hypothetical protein
MRVLRRMYLLGVAVLGLMQTAVYGQTPPPAFRRDAELVFLSAKGATRARIDVEIAERTADRWRGLMFREKMDENQGMLFIFPAEETLSFWMKDTPLALDIIYLNADRTIVTIRKNTVPYSEESVPSDVPAKYVVEVNAGFADRHRLEPGDKAFWQRL